MSEVLTAAEAARFLKLSPDSVKRKARAGVMPAAKVGREWRFHKADLDEWLAQGGTLAEEVIDRELVATARERLARTPTDDLVPWEKVKADSEALP